MTAPGSHLLLVEDDDTSAAFLVQALLSLPARVDHAGSIRRACELASTMRHALWIIDAHLPDGGGLDCMHALAALHGPVPALAITAGAPREELDGLRAGGFLEVLMKPVGVAVLQAAASRVLAQAPPWSTAQAQATSRAPAIGKQPVWEQQRALAAIGGNAASLAKLRALFLDELPAQRRALAHAQSHGDAAAVAALVHKLRAACGFVGAARLAQAVEALSEAPLAAAALQAFEFAAEDTASAPYPR